MFDVLYIRVREIRDTVYRSIYGKGARLLSSPTRYVTLDSDICVANSVVESLFRVTHMCMWQFCVNSGISNPRDL